LAFKDYIFLKIDDIEIGFLHGKILE